MRLFEKLFAVALVAACPAIAQASFFHDYSSEYSTTNNPNGVWEYDGVLSGALNSTKTIGVYDSGYGAWRGTPGDTFNLLQPAALHPGQFSDNLLGFAYPDAFAAPVSVHLSFYDAQPSCGGSGTTISLWMNDTHLQDIAIPDTFSGNIVADLTQTLSPGDTFYVRQAHNGPNNNCNNCGITSLTFTSTATPEPSSIILFGLGVVGLFAVARGHRRSA